MKQHCILFRAMLIISLLFAGAPFSQAEENGDSWEVQIIKDGTNELVKSGVVSTNSFSLEGLEFDVKYIAKVRTKNTFLSDWEVSDAFVLDKESMGITASTDTKGVQISSRDGQLFISSDTQQRIDIYTVDGCLLRSVSLSIGNTTVAGLANGLYIVNGQKIVVK